MKILRHVGILILIAFTLISGIVPAADTELWHHLSSDFDFSDSRGVTAKFSLEGSDRKLQIICDKALNYNWCSIPAPPNGWQLSRAKFVEVMVTNTGNTEVEFLLWVVANKGWSAVPAAVKLKTGESRTVVCDLRKTFPDKTPILNPECISKIQFMFFKPQVGVQIELQNLQSIGTAGKWQAPKGRLEVPDMKFGLPEAGERVWYQPEVVKGTNKYVALYLPTNYDLHKEHPVIVEFPGNIFFTTGCYSAGRPEACVIGYGMSKGKDAIWISMPFVQNDLADIIEDGWGDADHTADFTVNAVNEIIEKFSGDKDKVVLTGFSRGAIACGFIGLRNDTIASLWKGIHACQHYDGDNWKGASMAGAKERIKRFSGKYFETDNTDIELKNMLAEANVDVTYSISGLGAHATAMFLDNRVSTVQLRKWYYNLIGSCIISPGKVN